MKSFAYSMIALLFPFVLAAQDTYTLDEEYDINLDGTLMLKTNDANVTITGSNRSNVHLKVYRKITTKGIVWGDKEFSMEVKEENGNLRVYEKSSGTHVSVVGYMREEYTIDIQVPLGVNLDINADDDDFLIKNMKGSIKLDLDDGDAELRNCQGTEFRFDLDDGNIDMDTGSGTLYAKTDDGDIKVRNASFSEINASVDDGDLIIETSLADNGKYSFRADDSDIVLTITSGGGEFVIDHDDSRLYTKGNFETLRKDDDYTELKLAGGSAAVKIRVDDASIRIDSKNL